MNENNLPKYYSNIQLRLSFQRKNKKAFLRGHNLHNIDIFRL